MPAIAGPPSTTSTGPCEPWAPSEGCGIAVTDAPLELIDSSLQAATEVLWALSGRRYGMCSMTVRPRCRACWLPAWSAWGMSGDCELWGCGPRVHDLTLDGPIGDILNVQVDGAVLDPSAYTVFDRRILTRVDTELWPVCQRRDLPDGDEGTWSVTYTVGNDVPELGRRAVAELAVEMTKACVGQSCQLPTRITDLTRQGVSMRFIDPQEFLTEGRTGLYLSDLFIASHNPAGLPERSRVYSPDLRRGRIPT